MFKRRILLAAAAVLVLIAAIVHVSLRARARDALMLADPEAILSNPALRTTAIGLGTDVFARHCAACHGADGKGNRQVGAPDLTDGDWLYGSGQVAEIEEITLHGIRSGDPRGWDQASMPAYGRARPYTREQIPPLSPGEIASVVRYLRSLHGAPLDAAAVRGKAIFIGRGACWDCHADDASGDSAIGAPNLLDDVWLYGDGSAPALFNSIAGGHAGISPAFARTLTPVEARAVAAYVASLSKPLSKDSQR